MFTVEINGFPTRVWQAGAGPKLGFLAGFGGLPRWIPLLDGLAPNARSSCPRCRGFPGGDRGHSVLDTQLDWVLAVRELVVRAGPSARTLPAARSEVRLPPKSRRSGPTSVRRLALIAPSGLFVDDDPAADPWAQRATKCPA